MGHALEMLAAQMPLMWRDLDAPALAAPLNDRVSALLLVRWRSCSRPCLQGLAAESAALAAACLLLPSPHLLPSRLLSLTSLQRSSRPMAARPSGGACGSLSGAACRRC